MDVKKEIEASANNEDFSLFFEGAFKFFYVALETAYNPFLLEILSDYAPGFQRIAFVSFYSRGKELKKNSSVFGDILEHVKERDPESAETALREYLQKEFNTTIQEIKKWQRLKEEGEESLF